MRHFLVPLYAIIIFLVLWELLVWVNDWPNYKMASPSDIWPAFWKFKVLFFQYGWDTLWRTVVGLFIAVICGVFLGMIMGFSKVLREAIYPLLVGFNAIPKATVVPIIALMFVGQHDLNTVLIAFMISFFPIAVSVSIGLSTLEPEYRDILRSLGASKSLIFWKIALPKTLPEFFGALDAFTREDLWQVMHNLRKEEPFTGILITHDLRESIFLADEVVVLSGRPASKQFFVKVPKSKTPKLESLYSSKSIDMLKSLRKQIEIAQSQQEQNK